MEPVLKVLIVDDNPLVRDVLADALQSDPGIRVIGIADNGKKGVEMAVALKPDVITMDLRMPVMDGFEAIEKIMEQSPVPIVVVSANDASVISHALTIGAMDFVLLKQDLSELARELLMKVKIASKVKPLRRMKVQPLPGPAQSVPPPSGNSSKMVAIGISTGGPQALQFLLSRLPEPLPSGILIVQHITKGFIHGLADWLKTSTGHEVRVVEEGERLKDGVIFMVPTGYQIRIRQDKTVSLIAGVEEPGSHVPSADHMMKEVSKAYGAGAVGVIMTGMGHDGVEGIRCIKKAGGETLAQDEKSSAIFGMNKIAIESGAVDRVFSIEDLAEAILKTIS